jgi:hypothetical protein
LWFGRRPRRLSSRQLALLDGSEQRKRLDGNIRLTSATGCHRLPAKTGLASRLAFC